MHHEGTLNIELENPVRFDFKEEDVFKEVKWHPEYAPENFALIRAGFSTIRDPSPFQCLLYFASTSPHLNNPFRLEVVTQKIDLTVIKECSIHIKRSSRHGFFFGFSNASPVIQ